MRASDPSADDVALQALDQLITCLGASVDELQRAQARAEQLLADRRAGRPWLGLVTEEARPLVVERVSSVLSALAGARDTTGAGRRPRRCDAKR